VTASQVIAIDVALEPDDTMVGRAKAANAVLLKNFAKGFSLDPTHHPHVLIFAGFVPTADLPKVYAAAAEILVKENYTSWKLTVQVLLHSARPNRPGGHRGRAD
jgi:hypothetical protein